MSDKIENAKAGFFHKPLTASEVRALKNEYIQKGLDKEENTFVLYRIIGNDLYPRHTKGQSRENLQFVLANETPFEGCEKRVLVNRIIDPNEERAIIELVQEFGVAYSVIPFDPAEYSRIGFDLEALHPQLLTELETDKLDEVKRQRLQLALYRLKNNYVMNNNGARNFALREGRSLAKWVLPFDGNCFMTSSAWERLRTDVTAASYLKYFVVPMSRVTSNEDLLSDGSVSEPTEEPQMIFRKDACEMFNEAFCYGRRSKVELFWRLQIAGRWDAYKDDAWDQVRPPLSPEARQFGVAGCVARMFSGMHQLETQDEQGADLRWRARTGAILSTLRTLDVSLAGASGRALVSVRSEVLQSEVLQSERQATRHRGSSLLAVLDDLKQAASEALARGPYSVIDKTTLPPSGVRQDYWHPAPYWWPNPKNPQGPYMRKDGERVPGTHLYEAGSEKYDRSRLQRVFDDSLILALAWKFTGNNGYADHAANIMRRFFVDQYSRMNPHLNYSQVRWGHNNNLGTASGIIEMKDMYFYLDAVRLIEQAGVVENHEMDCFRAWLGAYLAWLLTSSQGKAERRAENNHGTCYDLQVAAIASFLDQQETVYDTLARAESRIAQQFAPDGSQPHELKRNTTAHYCCFNLQSWINLAELAGRWGVTLWSRRCKNGASLANGARWLLNHMGQAWPYTQIDAFDVQRFHPIWFAVADHIDDVGKQHVPESPYLAKSIFSPHDGIRPYWNLGSVGLSAATQTVQEDAL